MNTGRRALLKDVLRLAGLLAAVSVLGTVVNLRNWAAGGTTILWPAIALLTAHILCSPRERMPYYLATGFIVDLCVNIATGHGWTSLYMSGCNTLEATLASQLLHPVMAPNPDLRERRQFLSFLVYGMILAPGVTALLASFGYAHGDFFGSVQDAQLRGWFLADALGMATIVPLYIAYRTQQTRPRRSGKEVILLWLILVAATVAAFGQKRFPLLFIVIPCLLPLGIRLGLAASAFGLVLIATIGGILTAAGIGPATLIPHADTAHRDMLLQVFVATAMMTLYIMEVLTSESNRLQAKLQESENRFRLLAESSRDIITFAGLDNRRRYVSPAVRSVLGWDPEEMVGQSFHALVHPDDKEKLEAMLRDCIAGHIGGTLAYRCQTKAGEYLWLESNPQLYRDPATGEPVGVVTVARDITDRRKAEDELHRAFQLVENLASVDGLTGMATRRRFDETLQIEWQRAERNDSKISLLMIDVDHFKPFNDLYGHLAGDECLRRIGGAVRQVVFRANDLVARYGGEEFAVILPDTDEAGALLVCNKILEAVHACHIPHAANSFEAVTVSAGCATASAKNGTTAIQTLQAADQALYRAKAQGRNRVESAETLEVP